MKNGKKDEAKTIEKSPQKHPGGAPPGNKNNLQHGHNPRQSLILELGFTGFIESLDRRLWLTQSLLAKRERVYNDLGGKSEITELKSGQIDHQLCIDLLIDSALAYYLQPGSPGFIDKRTKRFRPFVFELQRLIETSARLAQALGLERRTKSIDIVGVLGDMAREDARSEGGDE